VRAVFRGVAFSECGFGKSTFEGVSFYRCRFLKVDFTRSTFVRCFFFDCVFENCDPYYASFQNTEVEPSSFKRCYPSDTDWNKAIVLFAELRRSFLADANGRLSRRADYYFRISQRRRLKYLWWTKQISGFSPWLRSFALWLLTGYGERPEWLAAWSAAVIGFFASIYEIRFPYALANPSCSYTDYLYLSFRLFFAQGFSEHLQGGGLFTAQVVELSCGLVLIALFIASVTRKLAP
jgi:hypothetical protein